MGNVVFWKSGPAAYLCLSWNPICCIQEQQRTWELICITSSPVYNEYTLAAGRENAGPRYVKRGNQSTIYIFLSEHFIQFFALFHCWKNWLPPSLWIESSACAVSQGRKGRVGRIKVSIRNYVKEPACRSNVSIMMVGWGDKSSTLVLFDSTLGWDQAKGEQPPSKLVLSHFTLNNRRDWMISKFASHFMWGKIWTCDTKKHKRALIEYNNEKAASQHIF